MAFTLFDLEKQVSLDSRLDMNIVSSIVPVQHNRHVCLRELTTDLRLLML